MLVGDDGMMVCSGQVAWALFEHELLCTTKYSRVKSKAMVSKS